MITGLSEVVRTLLHTRLERDEGRVLDERRRHVPYDDADGRALIVASRGNATIGYGRLLSRGLSEEEADFLLDNDIRDSTIDAARYPWFYDLNDARKCVVVAMLVNLGPYRFGGFRRAIGCLVAGNYAGAADEMLDSDWARQVGERAQRYARVMRTGVME